LNSDMSVNESFFIESSWPYKAVTLSEAANRKHRLRLYMIRLII